MKDRPASPSSASGSRRGDRRLFFLLGRGRSGTSLLARMLDSHADVAVAPEGVFILSVESRFGDARWTTAIIQSFVSSLCREDRIVRWRLDPESLVARLSSQSAELDFARACAAVYAESAAGRGRTDVRRLGDKNPLYGLFAGELRRLFPDAPFVVLVRDPRANVASFRRVPFDLTNVAGLAYRWARYNRSILDAVRASSERSLLVRYEDLVQRPEETLRLVCGHLGLEYRPEMQHLPTPQAEVPDWHRNLQRPLDEARLDRWRGDLSDTQIATVERICWPLAERFGYRRESSGRPATLRHFGVVAGWAMTEGERLVFHLPAAVHWRLIRAYRNATGNRIR